MNQWRRSVLIAVVAGTPVCAQKPAPAPSPFPEKDLPDIDIQVEKMQTHIMDAVNARVFSKLDAGLSAKLATLNMDMLLAQARGRSIGTDSPQYDAGTRLLDERKYDEAIQRFDRVINSKGDRADGALYWKAYALNRIGRREEALGAIAALRRDYPTSRWLNDAQALEVEVKQGSGQAVSPAAESNEDIKLMAINSLMNNDPERGMPLLENLLKGSSSPRVKDRAMFVLTQNKSARAQQILTEYAKGAGNPDLQIRALRYIGMSGTPEAQQQLASIYASSSDPAVKREIIRSLMVSKGRDQLLNLAKSEKDAELRGEAIRQLGILKATDQLVQLYGSEASPENKTQIIRALMIAGANDKLMDLAKSEKDPALRGEAIRNLAITRSTTAESLASLYSADSDPKTKRELINGLFSRGDARALVDLARKETDPEMKRRIVERLSVMHSKEATDYMMELLK